MSYLRTSNSLLADITFLLTYLLTCVVYLDTSTPTYTIAQAVYSEFDYSIIVGQFDINDRLY